MPGLFGHGSVGNWSARQDLHLRSLGPKPSVLAVLHYALETRCIPSMHRDFSGGGRISATLLAETAWGIGGPEGTCTLNRPADNGLLS